MREPKYCQYCGESLEKGCDCSKKSEELDYEEKLTEQLIEELENLPKTEYKINKFAQLLNDNNIQYEEIREEPDQQKLAGKLKTAYINDELLSDMKFYAFMIISVCACIYIKLVPLIILGIIAAISSIIFTFIKANMLYRHRKIYEVKGDISKIANLFVKHIVQKRCKDNNNDLSLLRMYKLISKHKKSISLFQNSMQKDDTLFIILFENKNQLCKSPMLLISKNSMSNIDYRKENYALESFFV